jgi:hypothetical protein
MTGFLIMFAILFIVMAAALALAAVRVGSR